MVVTHHAVQRYQQRVEPVGTEVARRKLVAAVSRTRARPTPRWWTPVRAAPGRSFVYPVEMPGVCLLIRDGAVVTVFLRSQCRAWDRRASRRPAWRPDSQPYHRPSPGAAVLEAA